VRYSRYKGGLKYAAMRVTPFAHRKLMASKKKIEDAMEANPELEPSLQGRRLTFSDVIVILCKEYERDQTL
jgi:hypothetical protein